MPESIQRDSWEPAGQSGQLLIYLFRCSVSLQVKVPVLVETVEIFTIGKKEGKKNAQKSNSKYQCEGSVLGLFFFCFFLFAWCSNVDVQNIDMGSVLWMSTMWIFLVPDMKVFSEFFLHNFIYKILFMKTISPDFWSIKSHLLFECPSAIFLGLIESIAIKGQWKGCSWPPSQFVVGKSPRDIGIQIPVGGCGRIRGLHKP